MRGRRGLASSMHWTPCWQSEREWERENRLAAVALVNIQIFGFCSATLQPKGQHQGLISRLSTVQVELLRPQLRGVPVECSQSLRLSFTSLEAKNSCALDSAAGSSILVHGRKVNGLVESLCTKLGGIKKKHFNFGILLISFHFIFLVEKNGAPPTPQQSGPSGGSGRGHCPCPCLSPQVSCCCCGCGCRGCP